MVVHNANIMKQYVQHDHSALSKCIAGRLLIDSTRMLFEPADGGQPDELSISGIVRLRLVHHMGQLGLKCALEAGPVAWWWLSIGPPPSVVHLQGVLARMVQMHRKAERERCTGAAFGLVHFQPSGGLRGSLHKLFGPGNGEGSREPCFRSKFMVPTHMVLCYETAVLLTIGADGVSFLGWVGIFEHVDGGGACLVCFVSHMSDLMDGTVSCEFKLCAGELVAVTRTAKGAKLQCARGCCDEPSSHAREIFLDVCGQPGTSSEVLSGLRAGLVEKLEAMRDVDQPQAQRVPWDDVWRGLPQLIDTIKEVDTRGDANASVRVSEAALPLDWLPDAETKESRLSFQESRARSMSGQGSARPSNALWKLARTLSTERRILTHDTQIPTRVTVLSRNTVQDELRLPSMELHETETLIDR